MVLPDTNNVPTVLVVEVLGTLLADSASHDDAVVLDFLCAAVDGLTTDVGVADVDEELGRLEARAVQVRQCYGE